MAAKCQKNMKIGDSMWNYGLKHWISVRKTKEGRGYPLSEKFRDVKEKRVGEKLTVKLKMEK